jgi:hypothetical protein
MNIDSPGISFEVLAAHFDSEYGSDDIEMEVKASNGRFAGAVKVDTTQRQLTEFCAAL